MADLKGKKKKKKPKITLEETSEQLSQLASKVEEIDISEPSHPPEPAQDEDFDALVRHLAALCSSSQVLCGWARCIIQTSAWYTIYEGPHMTFWGRARVWFVTMASNIVHKVLVWIMYLIHWFLR